jgi:xylulose-5-phosphate/fructose-6-phosphate phosphoketolase
MVTLIRIRVLLANILEKHGEFASAYFPADGNSFIVTMEECFKSRNKVNAITVDKQEVPQWLEFERGPPSGGGGEL